MRRIICIFGLLAALALLLAPPSPAGHRVTDAIETKAGRLTVTSVGHASLYFTYNGKVIQVDPWSRFADYGKLPKADLILITHDHHDHLDPAAIKAVSKPGTILITTRACAQKLGQGTVLINGQSASALGLTIRAVPAYNLVHKRKNGQPFHPKGHGNGYVIDFQGTKVYVAGDTENVPEMMGLQDIQAAFLPMNLPHTMTPAMVAGAAKGFLPKVLYPYHLGNSRTASVRIAELRRLLKDTPRVEVRVLPFGM